MGCLRRSLLACVLAAVLAPASALGALSPAASTGGARGVTPSEAQLTGTVNPHALPTYYYFQYGTATSYGSTSATQQAGSGSRNVSVAISIAGLASATKYHYRLVAVNRAGVARGSDRTFTSARVPNTLGISATPNPVVFRGATVINGVLTGSENANREVTLQYNAFPYTAGFANVGNPALTTSSGAFSFVILSLTLNTQYRVVGTVKPVVVSPIVTVGVALDLRVFQSTHRLRRGRFVRFSGTFTPAHPGAQVGLQKLVGPGRWVVIAGTFARRASPSTSRFALRAKLRHGGTFRIYVRTADGDHVDTVSAPSRLAVVRR